MEAFWSWKLHGNCMETAWRLHGDCMEQKWTQCGHNVDSMWTQKGCHGLWVHLGRQRGRHEDANGNHFGAPWGNNWKSDNCAPVEAGTPFVRSQGVLTDLARATLRTLSFSTRSGSQFSPILPDSGSHEVRVSAQ